MPKYRLADHLVFNVEGRRFLFLAENNAIFEMDDGAARIVGECASFPEIDIEDFVRRSNETAEESRETFEELVDHRVLVKTEESLGPRWVTSPEIPVKTLVLHVTDACNLGCRYCYYREKGNASNHRMSPAIGRRAVDFLFASSGNLKEVVIVFFGGEPLLNFELIDRLIDYAKEKASATAKKVSFAITTNGTLLTDKIIDRLIENDVGITISIDGFETAHDRHRCFPDGSGSYRIIRPKLDRLLKKTDGKPVVARVTLVGHPDEVPQILHHLLEMGFSEAGFAPVTTDDYQKQLAPSEMGRLLDHFRELSETFLAYAAKDELLGFTNLIDILVSLHEGEVKNYPCGAGLGLFSVDYDGRMYLCQRLNGDERFLLGDIFDGLDHEKVGNFRDSAEISRKTSCTRCWARALCAGGCYHEAMLREGDIYRPNYHYCDWIKRWIRIGLDVYGRIALDNPMYLDKLSLLRGHLPFNPV